MNAQVVNSCCYLLFLKKSFHLLFKSMILSFSTTTKSFYWYYFPSIINIFTFQTIGHNISILLILRHENFLEWLMIVVNWILLNFIDNWKSGFNFIWPSPWEFLFQDLVVIFFKWNIFIALIFEEISGEYWKYY
jgi:hypothetical protein